MAMRGGGGIRGLVAGAGDQGGEEVGDADGMTEALVVGATSSSSWSSTPAPNP
jgi:hypothetical protein